MKTEFVLPKVEGYGNPELGRALYDLACAVPSEPSGRLGLVVELGTYKGWSALCLAQADVLVMTFDHYEGEAKVGKEAHFAHVAGTYEPVAAANLDRVTNVIRYRCRTTKVPQFLRERTYGKEVALLFVDASHEADDVEADLRAWLPAMRDDGVIALDDWESHPGVKEGAERAFEGTAWYCSDIQASGRLAIFRQKEANDATT